MVRGWEIDGKFNQFQVAIAEWVSVISFGISLHYSALYDIRAVVKKRGGGEEDQQFFVAKSRLKLP